MRPGSKTLLGAALMAPALWMATLSPRPSRADEPNGLLGRLFRLGGSPASSSSGSSSSSAPSRPASEYPGLLMTSPAAATTPAPSSSAGPRLVPQPRVSRAATESDPIVTRVALARSNDGNSFAMFMQVFADGTVIDSEGVHHASQADLKPLMEALQAGELYRLKGHCGAPPTDFIEQVHMVVYERSYGRLRANAFSYSGNPQGCDHAVRHLHLALEGLQAKLSRPMPAASPSPTTTPAPPAPSPAPGPTIPLTAPDN
jgi:hypothetical protein